LDPTNPHAGLIGTISRKSMVTGGNRRAMSPTF
jgi:hypothetical protein